MSGGVLQGVVIAEIELKEEDQKVVLPPGSERR
jgi:hypothetical protein